MAIYFFRRKGLNPTGNAVESEVLAGKTFSNSSGIGKIGSMVNKGVVSITPTTTPQTHGQGYYGEVTIEGDADLQPSNIRKGVNIFGVEGTIDTGISVGTATADKVLFGETFSNGQGTGLAGTMPNRGAVTITPSNVQQTIQQGYHNGSGIVKSVPVDASKVLAGTTIAGTAGTMINRSGADQPAVSVGNAGISLFLQPPAGYYDGVFCIKADDVDFVAENIKTGVNIFGVTGTMKAGKYATGYGTGDRNVIVNNLDFEPTVVIIFSKSYYDFSVFPTDGYVDSLTILLKNNIVPSGIYMWRHKSTGGSGLGISPFNTYYQTMSNGFKCDIINNQDGYRWWAFA